MSKVPEPVEFDKAREFLFNHLKCNPLAPAWQLEVQPLAERFAAHRTAAVARREAEIVGILKQLANMHQETALRAKKNEHWSTEDREWFAGQVLESIVVKIQNGGGA